MPPENFKCKQCGNCCINLGDAFSTCATEEDIDLWEEEGRNDILEWVGFIPLGDEYVYDIWIWNGILLLLYCYAFKTTPN